MLSFQSYVCLSDNISNRSIIFYEWNDSKMFKCVWHSSFHLDHIIHSSCHCINPKKVYTEINCVFYFRMHLVQQLILILGVVLWDTSWIQCKEKKCVLHSIVLYQVRMIQYLLCPHSMNENYITNHVSLGLMHLTYFGHILFYR